MTLRRGQLAFVALVFVGAYGIDRGITALVWFVLAYYAAR